MNRLKKINFKQKKYVLPLVLLPFVVFMTWNLSNVFAGEEKIAEVVEEIDVSLSSEETSGEIEGKTDAYNQFYNTRRAEGRSQVDNIEVEQEEENLLDSNYDEHQRRIIDSLDILKEQQKEELEKIKQAQIAQENGANEKKENQGNDGLPSDRELLEMLTDNDSKDQNEEANQRENWSLEDMEDSQMRLLREQMFFLDSIEKSKDPLLEEKRKASAELKEQKQEYEEFLNSRLKVTKEKNTEDFTTVYKDQDSDFVNAVIDEDIKGYLGSRIRIRLLEPIYVGNHKLEEGSYMYAQISGFKLQRVELTIVSVMTGGKILPINLNVYDNDGMKGLYVPNSIFREMSNDMGSRTVQGQQLSSTDQSFYQNTLTSLFQSSSRAISNLIRKNKAKIKYNTSIYLIDESN